MCLRYGVSASPPYFLPFPPSPFLPTTGTLGAVIRIREPLETKREVFDIGVAGPIAGFLATLPVLAYGVMATPFKPSAVSEPGIVFQYPLLVTVFQELLRGAAFTSGQVREHPAFMAAWLGLLLTALNLIPLSQLDGGHALYAVAGRRHRALSFGILLGLGVLGWWFATWWFLAVVVIVVLRVSHPPVVDEDVPLDGRRKAVAFLTLLIFVVCFTPVPISIEDSPVPVPRPGASSAR